MRRLDDAGAHVGAPAPADPARTREPLHDLVDAAEAPGHSRDIRGTHDRDGAHRPRVLTDRSSPFNGVEYRTNAVSALRNLGWKPPICAAAVDAALAEIGYEAPLDVLIRRALQRCK